MCAMTADLNLKHSFLNMIHENDKNMYTFRKKHVEFDASQKCEVQIYETTNENDICFFIKFTSTWCQLTFLLQLHLYI